MVGVLPCAVFAPKAPKSSSLVAQRQSTAPYTTIAKSQIPYTASPSTTTVTADTSSELAIGVTVNSSSNTTTTCHCSSSNSTTAAVNNSPSKAGSLNLPPPLPPVPPRPPRVPLPIFAAANLASIRPLPSSSSVQSSASCSPLGAATVAATTVHHHHYNTAPLPPPPPVPPTAATALNPMLLVPFSVPAAGLGAPTLAATNHHPAVGGGYAASLGKVSVAGRWVVWCCWDLL